MNQCHNPGRAILRAIFSVAFVLLGVGGDVRTALAGELALVSGVSFDGSTITWQPLAGAAGYNIYRADNYLFTVGDVTEYVPTLRGEYQIIAYDADGNFSPLQYPLAGDPQPSNLVNVATVSDTVMPPQNVLGIVFSKTAGEIYWDRVQTQNLTYSVSLNGVSLGTTDGTSYWVDVLLPNTRNTISVAAVGQYDVLSEPVTLSFDTGQADFPIAATDVDSLIPQDAVLPPQNARLTRYSQTTAELFWDRAPLSENIEFYEIYREDEFLGTSPGTSFYDGDRMRQTVYTYELVAVTATGARSEPTFVNPGPFDGNSQTIVQTLLAGISDATTNDPHVEWGSLIHDIGFDDMPGDFVEIERETSVDNGVVIVRTVYECGQGTLIAERTAGTVTTAELMFDNCDTSLGGAYGSVSFLSEGGLLSTVEYDELEILTDTIVYVSGKVTESRARAGEARRITYENFEYDVMGDIVDDEERDVGVKLNQTIAYNADDTEGPSTYTVDMEISAYWSAYRKVTVTTGETFSTMQTGADHYVTGVLTAEYDDEQLVLYAATDDPDTWRADLVTRRATEEFSGQWNELIQLPCILLNEDCR